MFKLGMLVVTLPRKLWSQDAHGNRKRGIAWAINNTFKLFGAIYKSNSEC